MANPLTRVDVAEIIAARRLGKFHVEVVGLCALVLLVAGYDGGAVTYAAPTIARVLGLRTQAELQTVFIVDSIGRFLGVLIAGAVADKIGRKPVVVVSMLLMFLAEVMSAFTHSVPEMAAIRFLSGLGLGALLPATLALAVDFLPQKQRLIVATAAWLGYPIGGALAGPITLYLAATYPLAVVFLFGALLPLVLTPILLTALPESLFIMVRRGERVALHVRATMIRISRRYDFLRLTEFFSSEPYEAGFPPLRLFRGGGLWATPLEAVLFAALFIAAYFLTATLAGVLREAEVSPGNAARFPVLVQLCGLAGALIMARFAARTNAFLVLAAGAVFGAFFLAVVGFGARVPGVGALGVLLAGLCVLGVQSAAVAAAAVAYPSALRAAGLGFALGGGMLGQLVAPYAVGQIAALHLAASRGLLVAAALTLIVAAAALGLGLLRSRPPHMVAAET